MTLRKKTVCMMLALLMTLLAAGPALAAEEEVRTIDAVRFSIDAPLCGHVP